MKKMICSFSLIVALLFALNGITFAQDTESEDSLCQSNFDIDKTMILNDLNLERVTAQEEKIILKDLNLEKTGLSEDEIKAILTKGSATIWNKLYNGVYNIKISLSMTVSLLETNRPYTKITIKNTGNSTITVIAYKGSVLGSSTIHSMRVPAGATRTMTIIRNDVIKYGTTNGQGTHSILTYSVSAYNENGNKISFNAKGIRYY